MELTKQQISDTFDNHKNCFIADWELSQAITDLQLKLKASREQTRQAKAEVDNLKLD